MKKQVSTLTGTIIIIIATVILFGGAFAYQYFAMQNYLKISNSISQESGNSKNI